MEKNLGKHEKINNGLKNKENEKIRREDNKGGEGGGVIK
jgi:hypothetical protein